MSTTAIDEAKLEQFMGQMVGHMTGATACLSIWLGDELGLYRTLARGGARSAEDLAADSGCNPRLVRETCFRYCRNTKRVAFSAIGAQRWELNRPLRAGRPDR